jgi:glyoxylase-like metal-dependent hydrolase (beta-lactamase superfamily II)
MDEILPGVHHWTAVHPKIHIEVSSYLVTGNSPTLIDPLLPPDGIDALRELAEPEQIVLTNRHHLRHSERLAEAFGCPIRCNEHGLHEFEGGPRVEGFAFGDRLSPAITAHEVGAICEEETALLVDADGGALAVADGLIHYGELGFVPDHYLGDDADAVKRALVESYARLVDLEFDSMLFAHGAPLVGGARDALREFVEARSNA